MTRQAHLTVESFAAGSFVISAMLTALRTSTSRAGLHTERSLLGGEGAAFGILSPSPLERMREVSSGSNLLGIVAQPSNPVLWTLLAVVIMAVGLHVVTRFSRHDPVGPLWPQTVGLLLGALWPWVLNPAPPVGLALAALSCLLLVISLMPRWRSGVGPDGTVAAAQQKHGRHSLPIAFVAGWLLMASTSAFGMYVQHRLGLGIERSVLIGLLAAALLGAWAQLRMAGSVTFSLAVIWAMIGFAAATAGASITIATACVLGIAALAVVLVRVTT